MQSVNKGSNKELRARQKLVTMLSTAIVLTCVQVQSEELVIALGNFEPLFAKPDKPSLFKDLIDGVYAYVPSKKISYLYMLSHPRLIVSLNEKLVDGAANIFSATEINGCVTDPVFAFSDVAISKKKNHFVIEHVSQLADKSVVSYQQATVLLGQNYAKAVQRSLHYQEVVQPEEQAKLLANDLVDVSVGDKYIFLNSLRNWSKGKIDPNDFTIHPIFPPVATSMGFNEQALCDEFNQALVKYKQSGEYQNTYDKHLRRLGYLNEIAAN